MFAMQSCDEKEIPKVPAAIAFPDSAIPAPTFLTDGGTKTIAFSSTQAWTAGVEAGKIWCTLSTANGEAGAATTMTITVAKNETYDSRSAVVTIISEGVEQPITVTQSQNDSFSFTGAPKDALPATESTFVITTTENTGTPKVSELPEWITVATAPAAKGLTNTTLTFTVKENTTFDPREAKITITSGTAVPESFVVKQVQNDVLNPVSAATFRVVADGGAFSVTHNTNVTDLVVASKPDWVTEVTTRAAADKTHNFTATAMTAKEYGRHGVIVFKSATSSETISYTVHQGNIVTNTANATDRTVNTLTQTIKKELGLELAVVSYIKVLGTLNEADFTTLKTMSHIDLSEATVVGDIQMLDVVDGEEPVFSFVKGNAIPTFAFQLGNASGRASKGTNGVIQTQETMLQELKFPLGITHIGAGAFNANSINGELLLPSTVTYIGVMAFAYSGFTGTLTLPESLTSIGYAAFIEASFTGTLTLPESLTSIGDMAFSGNGFTGNLIIPKSITKIANNAFNTTSIETLTLHKDVTSIGFGSFCRTKLTKIISPAAVAPTVSDNREPDASLSASFYEITGPVSIIVPKASIDSYRTNWTNSFASGTTLNFTAIEDNLK